jgi:hypothetical protein
MGMTTTLEVLVQPREGTPGTSKWQRRPATTSAPPRPGPSARLADRLAGLAALAEDDKPATLARPLTSIARVHETRGFPSPATMRQAAVSETLVAFF